MVFIGFTYLAKICQIYLQKYILMIPQFAQTSQVKNLAKFLTENNEIAPDNMTDSFPEMISPTPEVSGNRTTVTISLGDTSIFIQTTKQLPIRETHNNSDTDTKNETRKLVEMNRKTEVQKIQQNLRPRRKLRLRRKLPSNRKRSWTKTAQITKPLRSRPIKHRIQLKKTDFL